MIFNKKYLLGFVLLLSISILNISYILARTPEDDLLEGATSGDIEKVSKALKAGASINARNEYGRTPLMLAVWLLSNNLNQREIVELLISKGADVNARAIPKLPKYATDNETVLISAINAGQEGQKEIIELLLSKGAKINEKDKYGRTTLIWAAKWGRVEIVKLLLDKGANAKIQDKDGKTALTYAKKWMPWDPEMAEWLEEASAK